MVLQKKQKSTNLCQDFWSFGDRNFIRFSKIQQIYMAKVKIWTLKIAAWKRLVILFIVAFKDCECKPFTFIYMNIWYICTSNGCTCLLDSMIDDTCTTVLSPQDVKFVWL